MIRIFFLVIMLRYNQAYRSWSQSNVILSLPKNRDKISACWHLIALCFSKEISGFAALKRTIREVEKGPVDESGNKSQIRVVTNLRLEFTRRKKMLWFPKKNIKNITTLCWEERMTGSTTKAVQYGLESDAKAVALLVEEICYCCCCWWGTCCCTIFFS